MARTKRWKNCLSGNFLTLMTVLGVAVGIAGGLTLRSRDEKWTAREIMYVSFPGDIFLNMLKALILPLIVSSIVSAIGNLDLGLSGKIGMRSLYYYGTTTICAVILGIILVLAIEPGKRGGNYENTDNAPKARPSTSVDTLLDLIRNVFPENLVQACTQQYQTVLTPPKNENKSVDMNETDGPPDFYKYDISSQYTDTTNTLGLVVFSIVLGITLGKMGEQGKPLLDFFNALSEAIMVITNWVIWISPVGVMFLISAKLLEIDDLRTIVGQLGLYFVTVLLGLFLHGFGTLTVIYYVCTRKLPFKIIRKLSQVMVTAFGTASSSATLPITLQSLDAMGNDPRITRFVVPIGATINMDGTALYEAVAAIFIAQVRGVELTFGKIIGISLTATAASIGAAGIPQAGLVTMIMVLDTVGLPAKDVGVILAVDWLLDRFRTTINVMCDALGACIIEHMSKGELDAITGRELEEAVELAHLQKLDN